MEQMKNKLYKLLVIREDKGNWQRYLDNLFMTFLGFKSNEKMLIFLGRLASLRFLEMEYFRSTVFDLMELLDHIEIEPCLEPTEKNNE